MCKKFKDWVISSETFINKFYVDFCNSIWYNKKKKKKKKESLINDGKKCYIE
jgi:hypothetical protein